MAADERQVDEKGRVTIPRRMRESLGIEPGEAVTVTLDDGRVVIRPQVSREEFVDTMAGVVGAEARAGDAEPSDPRAMKADWTSDV